MAIIPQPGEFHQLFGFILPGTLPDKDELQQMAHPWDICEGCGYLKCSCGNCHNRQQCNEPCLKGGQTSAEAR